MSEEKEIIVGEECIECDEIFELDELQETCNGMVCEACLNDSYNKCELCSEWVDSWNKTNDCEHTCDDCMENYYQCCSCSGYVHMDDVVQDPDSDDGYCDECFDSNSTSCGECGERHLTDNMQRDDNIELCSYCRDEHFYCCENCNDFVRMDESCESNSGMILCQYCYDEMSEQIDEDGLENSRVTYNPTVSRKYLSSVADLIRKNTNKDVIVRCTGNRSHKVISDMINAIGDVKNSLYLYGLGSNARAHSFLVSSNIYHKFYNEFRTKCPIMVSQQEIISDNDTHNRIGMSLEMRDEYKNELAEVIKSVSDMDIEPIKVRR